MLTLTAKKRDTLGKKVKSLRYEDLIPVVVYGPGEPTAHYSVKLNEFIKVWKKAGETVVVAIETDSDGVKNTLIQDVVVNPITGTPIHADFYAVKKGMTVSVNIPLRFEGDAPAIKAFGGILVRVMHNVEVEAEPDKLPQEIVVNVSSLETLSDRVTVKDLKLGEGVRAVTSPDEVIALVSAVVEKEEKVEEPADLSKIEVEKKGKKPEEGEEGAEPAKK
ncbi:MAG TPA: 50S ribosomal protein L25 [Candidatus Paceibacterota bacterium]|nr:50S ribosomal protein L25 [Candidatus Paceibacterota bacterium]